MSLDECACGDKAGNMDDLKVARGGEKAGNYLAEGRGPGAMGALMHATREEG